MTIVWFHFRIINRLCKQLDLPPLLKLEESERDATEYVQQQRIRDYLNFHTYDERIKSELASWLADRAIEGSIQEQLYGKEEQLFFKSWHVVLDASLLLSGLLTAYQLAQRMTAKASCSSGETV